MKVLLVQTPFGAIDRPFMGINKFKSKLNRLQVHYDISFLNVRFAELIGMKDYQWICTELPTKTLAGEWIFTAALYGESLTDDNGYIDNVLKKKFLLDDYSITRLMRIRMLAGYFLDNCLEEISWSNYKAVGLSSGLEQNFAALALAKGVKHRHPESILILDASNWKGVNSRDFSKNYSFIDYVCTGEEDEGFAELISRLRERRKAKTPNKLAHYVPYDRRVKQL